MTDERQERREWIPSFQAVIQNLKDAGCDADTIEQFLSLEKSGKRQEQIQLLSEQRDALLDKVHREEKRIGCLDYLVYLLSKEKKTTR